MMKNTTILAILFCTVHLTLTAQYVPMLLESNDWKVVETGWGTFEYYDCLSGDSLIDGQTWKRVYNSTQPNTLTDLIGLMREDENTQKVYVYANGLAHLIYDFDVQAGDIVTTWGVGMEQSVTVLNVAIENIGGLDRTVVSIQDAWGVNKWIEGIGSTYGLMEGVIGQVIDYGPVLSCFYQNNNLIWDNPLFEGTCDAGLPISILEPQEWSVTIYPNPFEQALRIEVASQVSLANMEVRMIGADGRLAFFHQGINSTGEISGLGDLSDGLYTLIISKDGKVVVSERIMKR